MGNAEGWADFKIKTADQGTATYVYAAFEPSLKGKMCLPFIVQWNHTNC